MTPDDITWLQTEIDQPASGDVPGQGGWLQSAADVDNLDELKYRSLSEYLNPATKKVRQDDSFEKLLDEWAKVYNADVPPAQDTVARLLGIDYAFHLLYAVQNRPNVDIDEQLTWLLREANYGLRRLIEQYVRTHCQGGGELQELARAMMATSGARQWSAEETFVIVQELLVASTPRMQASHPMMPR